MTQTLPVEPSVNGHAVSLSHPRWHPESARSALPALRMVQVPMQIRRTGRLLLVVMLATPFLLLFIPWQQTVTGAGKVIAYKPSQRPQFVDSPIDGRVTKWYVEAEGQRVEAGKPIVRIEDNDPEFRNRLLLQKQALNDRMRATQQRVTDIQEQLKSMDLARTKAIIAAEQLLEAARADRRAAGEALKRAAAVRVFAEENYRTQKALFENNLGLASKLEFVRAEQDFHEKSAAVEQAHAAVARADAQVSTAEANRLRITAEESAKIDAVRATLDSVHADLAAIDQSQAEIDIRINRFVQDVLAPVSGRVQRMIARSEAGGELVKTGDSLIEIVPDMDDPVVELLIDGNDMPLMRDSVGQHVRLQFEGWPAVQISGWPMIAVGTFGGKIRVIDPTDDGKGNFRILIEPDPHPEFRDDDWPEANTLLRQGVRAQGWVFLNRVPLWWELWRRINGFPINIVDQKDDKGSKPPKIKFPT